MINETTTSGCRLLIRDSRTTRTGTYDCMLGVKTNGRSEAYFYPLRVTVKEEQAKVTAKSNRAVNLFYRSEPASVDIGIKGSDMGVESVVWESDEADQSHGFSAEPVDYAAYDAFKKANNVERFYFKQGDIQLTDKNKPVDVKVFSGKVKVKVQGYKDPNEGVQVSFKWNYKKPVIVTKAASATLIPMLTDHNVGRFDLYNSTDKKTLLYHGDSTTQPNPKYYYSELSTVEGGNPKAKALLAEDLMEISQDSSQKNRIVVKVNRAETMNQAAIASGTYSFKITPCYADACGNTVKAKTLNLKIKVTNKAVTAKVKVTGKLDLTRGIGNSSSNYISLKTTFNNIGNNYTIKNNMRLYGEYSNYFDLRLLTNYPGQYRLRIKQEGKLKAGQRYKLALGYTIEMGNGDTFTVRSQTFTVTPKR